MIGDSFLITNKFVMNGSLVGLYECQFSNICQVEINCRFVIFERLIIPIKSDMCDELVV